MSAVAGRVMPLPKGEWNELTTYHILDMVSHNNSSWIAKRTNANVEPSPTNNDDWQFMFSGQKVYVTGNKIVIED